MGVCGFLSGVVPCCVVLCCVREVPKGALLALCERLRAEYGMWNCGLVDEGKVRGGKVR